jgi:hypothetical protein
MRCCPTIAGAGIGMVFCWRLRLEASRSNSSHKQKLCFSSGSAEGLSGPMNGVDGVKQGVRNICIGIVVLSTWNGMGSDGTFAFVAASSSSTTSDQSTSIDTPG